jgi:hypothetical protein
MLWSFDCKGGEDLEDWKIKTSVLWLIEEGTMLVYLILMLMEPGGLEEIMGGKLLGVQIGPELLLLLTIASLVPLIMAFLSLTLKDSTNRWANIILGIVFVVTPLVALSGAVAESWSAWKILNPLSGAVASALIVWYAWKSKQKA